MKNTIKIGFLALALSLSFVACNSEKTTDATDSLTIDSANLVIDSADATIDSANLVIDSAKAAIDSVKTN